MTVKTIYTCDRCGKEQATYDQFWRVDVLCRAFPGAPPATYNCSKKEQHWCRACCEELHLLNYMPRKEAVPPSKPAPTLEELIREIVQEKLDEQ